MAQYFQIFVQINIYKEEALLFNRSMYKEVASQANTKQLRKAKLLESFRQQPTVTRNNGNRIMLTDLCPQEKAKIGDLVRTLQTRKAQNMILENKIKQFERREKNYNDKIEEMERIIEQFKAKDLKFKQQLTLCKIKQQQRQRYIEHLLTEKQQQNKQTQNRKHAPCVDQFALTDPIITINQSVQASQKKRKCKEKQIQTQETFQFRDQARGYPHNSKSFEKIMRGRTQSQSNSVETNLKKSKEKMKRSTVGKRSQIKIDDNQQEQEHYDGEEWEEQVNQSHSERQDNEDDDFNELAKKWLQLKQKNMTKIKESYQKSKQRQNSSHSKGNRRQNRNTNRNIPRQFNERNIGAGQQQEEEHLQRMQNNQSFGPKRSNMKRSSSKSKGKQAQFDQDFDDIELNKILKSKNFSASRLLNKNTREISQQSEMQINRYGNRGDEKISKNKMKGMQPFEVGQNTPNMKTSTISNSRSHHNIDFYETDLLDIVSSINRK